MVAERFLKRQREEGREEGRAEGRSSQQRKWEDWNRRRMKAESRQEHFNEAPLP